MLGAGSQEPHDDTTQQPELCLLEVSQPRANRAGAVAPSPSSCAGSSISASSIGSGILDTNNIRPVDAVSAMRALGILHTLSSGGDKMAAAGSDCHPTVRLLRPPLAAPFRVDRFPDPGSPFHPPPRRV